MDSTRRTAFITGLLFIITFITAIPAALVLYTDVLDNVSEYIGGGGEDMAVPLGALLEMILIIGLYAYEWGERVRMRGGDGCMGQVTPPAWRITRRR